MKTELRKQTKTSVKTSPRVFPILVNSLRTNISKTGLAFRVQDVKFDAGACFDARIQIWTKETIDTVFKVVRVNELENGLYEYGCIFVGMTDTDALKIEIYQLFNDAE